MSPKITISNGERIIGEVDIDDSEVLGIAGDTLTQEVINRSNLRLGDRFLKRTQQLNELARTLQLASTYKTIK